MSPSNRTAERLRALEKALAAGKVTPEAAEVERARLAALGGSWEARWTLPNGKERFRTFSEAEHGKKARRMAEDFEAEQKTLVRLREARDPRDAEATLAKILDFYLEKRMRREDGTPKSSYRNARAHRGHIIGFWGDRFAMDMLDTDPERYIKALRKHLEKKLAKGSAWNNKVTCAAAVGYWIKKKRLKLVNPFDAYDWPAPDNARRMRISFEQHRRAVAAGSHIRPWLPAFLECGWETGWRSGEILDWRIERLHLDPPGEDFPWVLTLIEKQGDEEPVYEEKPFSFRLAAILRAYIGNRTEGPLWPGSRVRQDIYWRRAFNAAGLQAYRFHDYRRSIKKRMEDAGIADALAAEYTGHDEEMHERYKRGGRDRRDFHAVLAKLEPDHGRTMENEDA